MKYRIRTADIDFDNIYTSEEDVQKALKEYIKEDIEYADDTEDIDDTYYSVYQSEDGVNWEHSGYACDFLGLDFFKELEKRLSGDWQKSDEYIEMLNQSKITEEMIKDILFSINKKAKNERHEK